MDTKTYSAIIYKLVNESVYMAECPEVGTVSRGDTVEMALNNLIEITGEYLREDRPVDEITRPLLTTFEIEFKDIN
ncbi:MAG: type II toxin-antitoxin system HicB family antitoxin [Spirochaetota bacterium]|nr:type II toxin-antitoxin system HicB family antitoxin [Spirochaetota bacterium]